jgi:hypothetical protein
VLRFWRNPEFVRYVRAELRPPRAISAGILVLVICTLVGLACWGAAEDSQEFFRYLHKWLVGLQYTVLTIWCAGTLGQAISRERELKTYDFLRTTRLTSGELLVGKLLGVPIIGYFAFGCSLPVSIVAGVLAGVPAKTLVGVYVLLLFFVILIGLLSLWLSMLVEKSSAAAVAFLALVPILVGSAFSVSPFPGFGAISIFPALFSLYGSETSIARAVPTFFGFDVSFLALSVFLYTCFGAWFVLMLVRNLKKDREQIRLLSRWQALGFAAFLNVLFYAFLDPRRLTTQPVFGGIPPDQVSRLAVGMNALVLFLVGLAMVAPREKLKIWQRRRLAGEEGYFSGDGLPWPWLVLAAAMAYALLAAEVLGMEHAIPFSQWRLGAAAIQMLAFLIFITRDILFLQWCNLTRMKRPLIKGFLYLWLYYVAVGVLAFVVTTISQSAGEVVQGVLSPYGAFSEGSVAPSAVPGVYIGMVLQVGIIFLLLSAIAHRLRRTTVIPAASAA